MNNAYSPSIDSLHEIDNSHDRQNIKLGLGRIKSCLNSIGNPEKKFKSVIIGGTNGKGSVTYYLSNLAYRYSKLKIGRYTSPHLVFFNERYVINETPVTNEKLNKIAAESIRQIKEFEKKTNERLTAFEIYTIIGFNLFARENVDLAFIEVGMGGRLDATNVVEPKDTICSIITNVSFDHKNHLGSRIEDIAYEKAGIIKENNHTITGATDIALNIIQERAQELNNGLLKIKTTNPASNYIEKNIGIALTTWKLIIEKLGIDETIKDDKVTFLKSLQYAGRFHLLNDKYLIDCAHNPDGAIELNKLLDEYYRDKKKIFIIGMLDKEYDIFISNLIPKNSTVICTEPKSNRATKKEALQKAALAIGCKVVVEENIKSAIAKASSFNPELVVITGSVYFAGEAISVLSFEQCYNHHMFTQTNLKIKDKLPKFNLQGVDDKHYSEESFKESNILIVMFTCNHCPYVQAYEQRLINLQKQYQSKSVSFVAINSNDEANYPEDNFENMKKRAKEKAFNFPYLRDKTQEIAKAFGASYTPEIFLFDEKRILKYHGRVDDNWQEPDKVTKHHLKDAIEAVLNNKSIERPENQAIGCTVKWK